MTIAAKKHVNSNANSRNSAKPSIAKICSVYLTSWVRKETSAAQNLRIGERQTFNLVEGENASTSTWDFGMRWRSDTGKRDLSGVFRVLRARIRSSFGHFASRCLK